MRLWICRHRNSPSAVKPRFSVKQNYDRMKGWRTHQSKTRNAKKNFCLFRRLSAVSRNSQRTQRTERLFPENVSRNKRTTVSCFPETADNRRNSQKNVSATRSAFFHCFVRLAQRTAEFRVPKFAFSPKMQSFSFYTAMQKFTRFNRNLSNPTIIFAKKLWEFHLAGIASAGDRQGQTVVG